MAVPGRPSLPLAGNNIPQGPWDCPNCGDHWEPWNGRDAYRVYHTVTPSGKQGCKNCATREAIAIVAEQQLHSAMLSFGLDTDSYQAMTLEAYKPANEYQRAALNAAHQLHNKWLETGLKGKSSILFYAPQNPIDPKKLNPSLQGFGTGKTHLAVALAVLAAKAGFTVHVAKMSDLLERIKSTYNKDAKESETDILDEIRFAKVIVLDDIGVEHLKDQSSAWYQDIVYRIIDHAYMAHHAVIMTSNSTPAELRGRLGGRVVSRLGAMLFTEPLQVLGPDRRTNPF